MSWVRIAAILGGLMLAAFWMFTAFTAGLMVVFAVASLPQLIITPIAITAGLAVAAMIWRGRRSSSAPSE